MAKKINTDQKLLILQLQIHEALTVTLSTEWNQPRNKKLSVALQNKNVGYEYYKTERKSLNEYHYFSFFPSQLCQFTCNDSRQWG